MKEKVIQILKEQDILELHHLEEFCELLGSYVNMESILPDGSIGKILDDEKTYLCSQVPINDTECYGVVADEAEIIIYRYKNDDSESRIVKIISY